jgi:hypothetical protein
VDLVAHLFITPTAATSTCTGHAIAHGTRTSPSRPVFAPGAPLSTFT